jgi:hypothetical protein
LSHNTWVRQRNDPPGSALIEMAVNEGQRDRTFRQRIQARIMRKVKTDRLDWRNRARGLMRKKSGFFAIPSCIFSRWLWKPLLLRAGSVRRISCEGVEFMFEI